MLTSMLQLHPTENKSLYFQTSHVTKIIMNLEVPSALRVSGYLLCGVVRIYSKKVEYLQHDCNALRIEISKAYENADINLPENANQAKYESIILPHNFVLDLMGSISHSVYLQEQSQAKIPNV